MVPEAVMEILAKEDLMDRMDSLLVMADYLVPEAGVRKMTPQVLAETEPMVV
jgi:hypothetical protein